MNDIKIITICWSIAIFIIKNHDIYLSKISGPNVFRNTGRKPFKWACLWGRTVWKQSTTRCRCSRGLHQCPLPPPQGMVQFHRDVLGIVTDQELAWPPFLKRILSYEVKVLLISHSLYFLCAAPISLNNDCILKYLFKKKNK